MFNTPNFVFEKVNIQKEVTELLMETHVTVL